MCHGPLRSPFDLENVLHMVRSVFAGRAVFHDGDSEIVPGLKLYRVGGHSAGLQILRVWTRRGWVVVAADASHLYAHFQEGRIFPVVYNVGDMLEGYKLLYRLADSPEHIVPGHDPLVMKLYPAARPDLAGIVVRLDVAPGKA
jgi:glyoxylase-like metal-dependent hydrolase (beta-lactamase superfamily II)